MYEGLDNERCAGGIPRTEDEIISGCAVALSVPNAHCTLLSHGCYYDVPRREKTKPYSKLLDFTHPCISRQSINLCVFIAIL